MEEERRSLNRHAVAVPCRFEGPRKVYDGQIKNLSDRGAFIESEVAPHPGALVVLIFNDSEGQEHRVGCRVVHRGLFEDVSYDMNGFGVEFTEFHGSSRAALKGFL